MYGKISIEYPQTGDIRKGGCTLRLFDMRFHPLTKPNVMQIQK